MKHIYTLLAGILFLIGFYSCYDDKGNYKYEWVRDIDLAGVLKDTTVKRGSVLKIDVNLQKLVSPSTTETEAANPEDYTYLWQVAGSSDTLGIEKNLYDTIWLKSASDAYQINYTVTEKASGISWTSYFQLTVVDHYKGGYIFMTEDAEKNVEIELYANTTDGGKVHEPGVLARSGFPYTHGGANAICLAPFNEVFSTESDRANKSCIWIATGEATGWLGLPNFDWQENYMIEMLSATPPMVGERIVAEQIFLIKDNRMAMSSVSFAMSSGDWNLYPQMQKLVYPNIAFTEGTRFRVAPFVAGKTNVLMQGAFVLYELDNKRFLTYPVGNLTMGSKPNDNECYEIPSAEGLTGSDLLYMQSLPANASHAAAIIKSTDGKYWKCLFLTAMDVTARAYRAKLQSTEELKGNASVASSAEYWVMDQTYGYVYCSVGNKLYTYRTGAAFESFEEVTIEGLEGELDDIVSLNVTRERMADIWVSTYSDAKKGKVYILTPNPTESRTLTITEIIDTDGAVKRVTQW